MDQTSPEWVVGVPTGEFIPPKRRIAAYPLLALVICSLATRLYARIRIARQLALDDYLIILATCLLVALIGINAKSIELIQVLNDQTETRGIETLMDILQLREAMVLPLKFAFMSGLMYAVQMALTKLSILTFYHRLMLAHRSRWGVYAVAAFVIITTVVVMLLLLCMSSPISGNWHLFSTSTTYRINPFAVHVASSATHIVSDVLILLLPIPIVWRLQMSTRKKVGLMFIFMLGIIGTIASIVRLIKTIPTSRRTLHGPIGSLNSYTVLIWWSALEVNMASLCANLPALAGFWRVIRRQRKASYRSAGSTPSQARPYQLGSVNRRPDHHHVATTGTGDVDRSSQEQMLASKHEIVRSTHVVVDIEHAPDIEPAPAR